MTFTEVPFCRRTQIGSISAIALANPNSFRSNEISFVAGTGLEENNKISLFNMTISKSMNDVFMEQSSMSSFFDLKMLDTKRTDSLIEDLSWMPGTYSAIVAATFNGLDFYKMIPDSGQLEKTGSWSSPESALSVSTDYNSQCSASALKNGSIVIHSLDSNKHVATFKGHNLHITGIDWRTQSEVITASRSGHLRIYDTRNSTASFDPIVDKTGGLTCLAVHPTQRNLIVTGNESGEILMWDLARLDKPFRRIKAHRQDLTSISFDIHNAGSILSSSLDGTICKVRYDFENPELVIDYPRTLYGHTSHPLSISDLSIHSVHKICIAGGDGGAILGLTL